jgi:hypothetical protein
LTVTCPFDEPEFADSILETLDDLCRELGLVYFLCFGTCLGFYRDANYIEEDSDIDVVVVATQEEYDTLWSELVECGFDPQRGLRRDDIQLDLQRTEEVFPYITPSSRPYVFWDFDTVFHHGRSYRVPRPIERYLDCEYDGLWKIPILREAYIVSRRWDE